MGLEPERSILADCELLERLQRRLEVSEHPLVRAAFEADIRYLKENIERFERCFFVAQGLDLIGDG